MCLCRNAELHSSHQIASKCTKSHMEFQKFSGGDTPGPPSRIGKVQRWQPCVTGLDFVMLNSIYHLQVKGVQVPHCWRQRRIYVLGGLGTTLFGGSLGGPIREVTSQNVRERTHAFTIRYEMQMSE